AIGLDKSEEDVIKRKPTAAQEGICSRGLGYKICSRGLLIGSCILSAFIIGYQSKPSGLTYVRSFAFTTLVLAQLIHVFDCRNVHSIFDRNPFENIYLVFAVISSLLLLLVVIYWEPLQPIFHTTALGIRDWMLIVGLGALPTVLFGFKKQK